MLYFYILFKTERYDNNENVIMINLILGFCMNANDRTWFCGNSHVIVKTNDRITVCKNDNLLSWEMIRHEFVRTIILPSIQRIAHGFLKIMMGYRFVRMIILLSGQHIGHGFVRNIINIEAGMINWWSIEYYTIYYKSLSALPKADKLWVGTDRFSTLFYL